MVMIGSDGNSLAPYGITGQGKPHPRFYGTFPRVLGHYTRDLGLITLPLAVYKMTGGSAAALGLTVFDPQHIGEQATYDDPHQYASGVTTVLVNGTVVIDRGNHTEDLPGRVLRRSPGGVR
jgi:N-acyl-D-amino-acid deacylase